MVLAAIFQQFKHVDSFKEKISNNFNVMTEQVESSSDTLFVFVFAVFPMSVLIVLPSMSICSYLTLVYAVIKKRVDLYPSSICFAWFFAWFLFLDVCKEVSCLSKDGFNCYSEDRLNFEVVVNGTLDSNQTENIEEKFEIAKVSMGYEVESELEVDTIVQNSSLAMNLTSLSNSTLQKPRPQNLNVGRTWVLKTLQLSSEIIGIFIVLGMVIEVQCYMQEQEREHFLRSKQLNEDQTGDFLDATPKIVLLFLMTAIIYSLYDIF